MFLFEQTAAFIPDLFRALPNLEYIADQPGPCGRAFRQRPCAGDQTAAGHLHLGKREKLPEKSMPGLHVDAGGSQLTCS